jgi:hypothetical protein
VNDCFDIFDCLLISGEDMYMWTPDMTIFVAPVTELVGQVTLDAVSDEYFQKECVMATLPDSYQVVLQYTSLMDKYLTYHLPITGAEIEYILQLPDGYAVADIRFIDWSYVNGKVSCAIIFKDNTVWSAKEASSSADVELTLNQQVAQTTILSQNPYTIIDDMMIVVHMEDEFCYVLNLFA